ncbi:hypothetical protein MM213_14165 [Belliella sp. R4-6]|uniref:DUF2062 domain-containing protein n=1 Tax=Belliella alkalica TaxID=1730871 RepID=A0ABS9VDX7_9BACT|nr:hypothetical protein [Belliella alkalica]MCH7414641.1 hypothetical protein [Belliella alkalica]
MIRFIALLVFSSLFILILGPFFSYPIMMVGVILLSYLIGGNGTSSFLAGGFSFGLIWFFQAVYISLSSNSTLPTKMAELMGLADSNLLWIATGVIGFILGSFSGLTGSLLRNILRRKRDEGVYRL